MSGALEEAAQEGAGRREGGTVHALHLPPYVPDARAAFMDPHTLAYLAGHSDFSTTRRYVHPQADTIKAAMECARGGHRIGHSESETTGSTKPSAVNSNHDFSGMNGRGERIRTSGLLVPNQALYQAEPRPDHL